MGEKMDGWIVLDKPTNVFSKKAAMRVARLFGATKNGHIGTLDPMASGVLPVALGAATKMIPFLEEVSDRTKEYLFSVQFGFETDTLDITGSEIARSDIVPDTELVKSVLGEFVGETSQIPPVYSAVHVGGRRAYELARNGKSVDMPSRLVSIYLLELTEIVGNSWHFRMRCSPGTYVRSVARDIAKRCGTLATVDMIRRTQTSGFTLKNAVGLDFLEKLVEKAVVFQNRHPRVSPQQEIHPHGKHNQSQRDALKAGTLSRHKIRGGIANQQTDKRRNRRQTERAHKYGGVNAHIRKVFERGGGIGRCEGVDRHNDKRNHDKRRKPYGVRNRQQGQVTFHHCPSAPRSSLDKDAASSFAPLSSSYSSENEE